jgi:hypothetical protein
LAQLQVDINTVRKVGFGISTLFAAYLMGIPAAVYTAKLDSNNQISKLESRIVVLEVFL